jgi:inosose dehydratase
VIKLGYHPATFHGSGTGKMLTAVATISREGWDGFEYSARALEPYFPRPADLKGTLAATGLEISGLYYTCGFLDDAETEEWLSHGERVAEFCTAVGCHLILIDGGRKTESGPTDAQIARAAEGANAMGRLARRHGLLCSWHQHWGTIFEYQEPFERLLALTDPDLVKFTPDTAQLSLGDFDVPDIFRRHVGRMVYVHFKDLGEDRRFTELGTGIVDFPTVTAILRQADFSGWIVVDLDYTSLDPRESCRVNKAYLNGVLGLYGARDLARQGRVVA